MSTKVLNVGSHSVDLDSGRTLAPGERATIDIDEPHNKALLEQGHILVVEPKQRPAEDSDDGEKSPKTTERTAPKREDKTS